MWKVKKRRLKRLVSGFCDWKIWLDELEQWTGSYMQVQQKRLEGLALGFCDYRKWSDELELWIGLYM